MAKVIIIVLKQLPKEALLNNIGYLQYTASRKGCDSIGDALFIEGIPYFYFFSIFGYNPSYTEKLRTSNIAMLSPICMANNICPSYMN